jgi:hypothetical protein
MDIPGLMKAKRPEHLHGRRTNTANLELSDGLKSARLPCLILSTEEVKVETTSNCSVDELAIAEEPFLTMGITRIDTMGLSLPGHIVAGLLVEWECPIDVAVYSVAGIYSVKRLRVVVAKSEVANVLCETVDIVVL